jgi:hypothetical protein
MIGYAPNDGSRHNMDALRTRGWRLLLTPTHRTPYADLSFAIDNGAWRAYQLKVPFDEAAFENLVDRLGCAADFVILPDIVGGGNDSLAFSVSWLPRLRNLKHLLLPIQNGMNAHDVGMVLRQAPRVGLFLGGTTEYKLAQMYAWGMVAHAWNRWFHVGRVNSIRRVRLCAEAGADSFDGSSVTIFSDKLARLDPARQQPSLLTPARLTEVS